MDIISILLRKYSSDKTEIFRKDIVCLGMRIFEYFNGRTITFKNLKGCQ